MRVYPQAFLFGVILWLSSSCYAAICSLNVQGIIFGSYDIFATTPLDSTGNIDVLCDVLTNFTVVLSTGACSYANRQMLYQTHTLSYNLYRNAARTSILGDGTGGSVVINATARVRSFTVYGRIPARQNIFAGRYDDNVIVTVSF